MRCGGNSNSNNAGKQNNRAQEALKKLWKNWNATTNLDHSRMLSTTKRDNEPKSNSPNRNDSAAGSSIPKNDDVTTNASTICTERSVQFDAA
jgi:hypothetical protein